MITAWVRTATEWVAINTVEVINCEESIDGKDIVTFIHNGVEFESFVATGSRPG